MPQSLEEVHSLVRTAIVEKRPITAIYKNRERLMCPHVLGRNREGRLQVLCYQFGGGSERGLETVGASGNWRCLALAKLSDVHLLAGPWETAQNRLGPQTCVEQIELEAEEESERDPQAGH